MTPQNRSNEDFLRYFVYYNVVNIYRIPYTIQYNHIDNVKYKVEHMCGRFGGCRPGGRKRKCNSSETCKTCFVRLPFAELVQCMLAQLVLALHYQHYLR